MSKSSSFALGGIQMIDVDFIKEISVKLKQGGMPKDDKLYLVVKRYKTLNSLGKFLGYELRFCIGHPCQNDYGEYVWDIDGDDLTDEEDVVLYGNLPDKILSFVTSI